MLARVLEISDQNIYLEIDSQLRFRSKYILPEMDTPPKELSQVDFDFTHQGNTFYVIIRTINPPRAEPLH